MPPETITAPSQPGTTPGSSPSVADKPWTSQAPITVQTGIAPVVQPGVSETPTYVMPDNPPPPPPDSTVPPEIAPYSSLPPAEPVPPARRNRALWLVIVLLLLAGLGYGLKLYSDKKHQQSGEAVQQLKDELAQSITTGNLQVTDDAAVGDDLTVGGTLTTRDLVVEGDAQFKGSVSGIEASFDTVASDNFTGTFRGTFIGDGSGLENVDADTLDGHDSSFFQNASNLTTGTLSDARLSDNVALLDADQTFTGSNTFQAVTLQSGLTGTTADFSGNVSAASFTQDGNTVCDSTNNCGFATTGAAYVQGGNSFGTTAVLGTNDTHALVFETVDTERVRIDTSGNVGIGTNAPLTIFHVRGDDPDITLDINSASASGLSEFRFATDGAHKGSISYNKTTNDIKVIYDRNATGTGEFQIFRHGNARLVINNAGNVGIGTTTPTSFKLEVAGNIGPEADNTRDLGSASRRWANIYATNIQGAVTPSGFTQGSVVFAGSGGTLTQDNANFFWDDANNRLGLGTTTPNALLHGMVTYTDTAVISRDGFRSETTLAPAADSGANIAGTTSLATLTGSSNFTNSTFGAVGINAAAFHSGTGTANKVMGARISARNTSTGTVTELDGVNTTILNTNASGLVSSGYGLRVSNITNSGTLTNTYGVYIDDVTAGTQTNQAYGLYQADTGARNYFAGNVGIGTTSPGAALHVSSANFPVATFERTSTQTNTARGTARFLHTTTADMADEFGVAADWGIQDNAGLANTIASIRALRAGADNTGRLEFQTANAGTLSTAMSITPAGSIGIGTTTPASMLNLSSDASLAVDLDVYAASSGSSGQLLFRRAKGTAALPSAVATNDRLGIIGFAGYTSAGSFGGQTAAIRVLAAEGYTSTAQGSHLTLETTPIGSTGRLERLRVDSSGNIGIGTSTPTSFKLEVAGNVGPEADNTRDLGSPTRRWANIYGNNIISSGSITATGHFLPAADDTYDLGSSSLRWRDLYLGPTSLHIQSTAAETTTTRDWKLSIQETDGTTEGNLRVMEGSNELVSITPSGNVGIGTTSPINPLAVSFSDSSTAIGANTASVSIINTDQTLNNWSNLKLSFANGSGAAIGGAFISAQMTDRAAGAESANLHFRVRQAGGLNDRLTILSNGNVGIGTTAPSSILEIFGDAPIFTVKDNDTTITAVGEELGSINFSSSDTSVAGGIAGRIVSVSEFTNGAYEGLAFHTYQQGVDELAERVRITRSGNVGIGTTSPAIIGYVGKTLTISSTGASDRSAIELQGNGGTTGTVGTLTAINSAANTRVGTLDFINDGATNSGAILFNTNNSGSLTEKLRITSTGNVGIGATAPAHKLEVASGNIVISGVSADTNYIRPSNTTSGSAPYLQSWALDSVSTCGTHHRGAVYFGVKMTDDGTLTGTPCAMTVSSQPVFTTDNASNPTFGIEHFGFSRMRFVTRAAEADNTFTEDQWTEAMSILTSGNVGIGTTSPLEKLHVGSGRARIVTTGTDDFSAGLTGLFIQPGASNTAVSAITLRNRAAGSGAGLDIDFNLSATDTVLGKIKYERDAGGAFMAFHGYNGTTVAERMRIASSGNVGIGDTTPASMFTVGNGDLFQVNSSGNIAQVGGAAHTIANASGALSIDAATSGALNLNNTGTGDVLIAGGSAAAGCTVTNASGNLTCSGNITTSLSNGTVGYWTRAGSNLSPATATDTVSLSSVGGTAVLTSTATGASGVALALNAPSNANHLVFQTGGTNKWIQYLNGNDLRWFESGVADRLTLQAGGNVGIGTTTPNTLGNGSVATMLGIVSNVTTTVGQVIRAAASQTADLLQAQDSTGAVLARIDASGNLTVKATTVNGNLTINGHIVTGNSSGSTTVAPNANCGVGCTVSISGNDTSGVITINTGTAPTSGTQATVTFANAYGAAPRVILTPLSVPATSTYLQYHYDSTTTTFDFKSYNAPSASVTYTFSYHTEQ